MARNAFAAKAAALWPSGWRLNLAKVKWNKIIYDRINKIEKPGKESTKPQKPLRLGSKTNFRRRLRLSRLRVSKFRVRVKISPRVWLRKLCDGYVNMMRRLSDEVGGGEELIMGFDSVYPTYPGIA